MQRRVTVTMLAAVVALVLGWVLNAKGNFAIDEAHDQLVAQEIFFPERGSEEFAPETYPELQKYAGQRVDNGAKAKAYADDFILAHLQAVNDGRADSDTSATLDANPADTVLASEAQALLRGEARRAALLHSWEWDLVGRYALKASTGLFVMAIWLVVLAAVFVIVTRKPAPVRSIETAPSKRRQATKAHDLILTS